MTNRGNRLYWTATTISSNEENKLKQIRELNKKIHMLNDTLDKLYKIMSYDLKEDEKFVYVRDIKEMMEMIENAKKSI